MGHHWKAGGDGVEHFSPEQWAAALHLLSGGRETAFTDTATQILERGNEALALKIADYGLVADLFEVVPALTEEFKKLLEK